MKTITGTVAFVNENERSDNIVLEDKTRITLRKGVAKSFFGARGKQITAQVSEKEFNGKTIYNAEEKDIAIEGLSANPASKYSPSKKSVGIVGDARQESIVFQNSMAHATAIMLHNSQGEQVDVKDVLRLAKTIAKVSLNPNAGEEQKQEQEQATTVKSISPDVF